MKSVSRQKLVAAIFLLLCFLLLSFKIYLGTSDAPQDDQSLLTFSSQSYNISFSRDGNSVITGVGLFSFSSIQWWDAKSGNLQITFQSPVSDGDLIIVSKDEKLIISCRKDVFDCRIRLWEIPSGRLIWQKTGKFQEKLALSPDKSLLVGALDKTTILPSLSPAGPSYTTRNDYSIQIWDTKTGTLKRTLPEFESAIDDIEFSSNGKLLVVATRDKVRFWETKTWKIVQTLSFPFPYEMSSLDAVTFSPDAKLIMITERGHQAEIWDWHAKKRLCKLDNSHLTEDMTFSPNGKFIAGGGEQPFLTKMGQLQMRGQRNLPPNDRGISGVETKGALHIWEVSTGKVIKTFYTGESVSSVAFAPDGKTIASGERQGNRIRLWDASDLQ